MVKFSRLLLGLPAVWMLAAAAAAADDVPAARGLPGCATRCGDIDVPYPFGLDPQCAIHAGFQLNCTTVGRTTKLFHSNLEVIKLSVQDGKVWLKTWISRECYNQTTSGMLYGNYAWMNITGSPYVLSADDNKIIVLGCNSFAYMRSDSYIIGCLATCDVDIPPKNGSCSGTAGAGCCEVDLPKGVRVYQGFFNSLYNTTAIWRNTPCNYVTVMERAAFNFSTTYLTSSVFYDRDDSRSPVVMEWGITQKTCEAAKIDKAVPYACVSNYSKCITNEAGYLCKCSRGQWRSHVQPSGSDDPDDLAVTPYSDQFLTGYDPARIFSRPQWPSSSSLQFGVHLLSPTTAVRSHSPSDPSSHQGHVRELEKAKRCLASLPRTPIQRQVRHRKSPAAGRQRRPYLTTCRPAMSHGSAAHSVISSSPAVVLAPTSRQDKLCNTIGTQSLRFSKSISRFKNVLFRSSELPDNRSTLEGFLKRKLPLASDNENNHGDTSRIRRDGDGTISNINSTIQRTSRISREVERCFSAMKIVKTILRNRIGDGFMNDRIICIVEPEFLSTTPIEDVIVRLHKMEDRSRRGKL